MGIDMFIVQQGVGTAKPCVYKPLWHLKSGAINYHIMLFNSHIHMWVTVEQCELPGCLHTGTIRSHYYM